MLRSIKALVGYVLSASDGEIGRCDDFLFDDRNWTVRFMVAKTAKWLTGRQVVISPGFLGEPDWAGGRLPVRLTRRQIEDSPPLAEHAPMSAAYEREYWGYYSGPPYDALPPYGVGPGAFGALPWAAWANSPGVPPPAPETTATREAVERSREEHLRSVAEVVGYGIAAPDRDIGEVDDFAVDDLTWVLRYLVVDTGLWLPGRRVLVAPPLLGAVDWPERRLYVGVDAERIRNAPEYDPAAPIDRRYEAAIHEYYGLPHYWT